MNKNATHTIPEMFREFKLLLWLAFPIVFNALIGQTGLVSLYFVGRLDEAKYIGGATLGSMMCNLTGYSLMIGMCSALDTLLSQAYGSKSYYLLGLYVQRAMLILTACSIVVALLWSQTDKVLIYALGIEEDTANLACIWAKILAFGLWPSLIFEALKRWLQSQNLLWPTIISTSAGTIFNIIFNYYFLYYLNTGFEGVALCLTLSQWFQLIILCIIVTLRKLFIFKYYKPLYKSSIKSSSESMINHRNNNNSTRNKDNHEITSIYKQENSSEYNPIFSIDRNSDNDSEDMTDSNNDSKYITTSSALENNNADIIHRSKFSHSHSPSIYNEKHHIELTETKTNNATTINYNNTNNSYNHKHSNNNNILLHNDEENLEVDEEDSNQNDDIYHKENNFPLAEPAVLDGWPHFLQLGIPGALSMFIEW